MTLSGLDSLLWAAGLAGNTALVAVLVVRHRARQFPFFTAFIFSSIVRSVVLYLTSRDGAVSTYFYAYWTLAILIDVVLQFAVVYELATHVFRPLGRWAEDTRRGMGWLLVLSLLVAGVLTGMATRVSAAWQEAVVVRGSFFSSALLAELFVGMVTLSMTAGLPWRTHVARIAQGLGLYCLLDVCIDALLSISGKHYGTHTHLVLDEIRKVFYMTCVGYWIAALWAQAPAPRELPVEVRKQLHELQARLTYDLYTLRGGRRS